MCVKPTVKYMNYVDLLLSLICLSRAMIALCIHCLIAPFRGILLHSRMYSYTTWHVLQKCTSLHSWTDIILHLFAPRTCCTRSPPFKQCNFHSMLAYFYLYYFTNSNFTLQVQSLFYSRGPLGQSFILFKCNRLYVMRHQGSKYNIERNIDCTKISPVLVLDRATFTY